MRLSIHQCQNHGPCSLLQANNGDQQGIRGALPRGEDRHANTQCNPGTFGLPVAVEQTTSELRLKTTGSSKTKQMLSKIQKFHFWVCMCVHSVASDSLWALWIVARRGIFQARILEWVITSFSRRSSSPRDWTVSLASPALANSFSTTRAVWEAPFLGIYPKESKAGTQTDICTPRFTAALFSTAKTENDKNVH